MFASTLVGLAISVILWNLLRRWLVGSVIDDIPGPAAKSFWKGLSSCFQVSSCSLKFNHRVGSFDQVFNANAWDFHTEIAQKCE